MSSATARPVAMPARSHRRQASPTALVIGPLPPPFHGGAVATQYLLGSAVGDRFRLVHVDTADARGMENIGRLDAGNVRLALAHTLRYLRTLRRERPDLVYVPVAQSRLGFIRDSLFLLPARMLGKRVIVHFHGGGFQSFYRTTDPITRAVVRGSLHGVARAIVLGQRLREMVGELVPAGRIAVVPNGIEDPFGRAPARSHDAEPGAGRVLYLGTLMAEKGFLDVIASAALLAPQRPALRYTFAGAFFSAADRERTERYLEKGLHDRIELAGVVHGESKTRLLREADMFVFPSYAHEGHPYVILEAMAAGLPIITTARAAIAESIIDGETGLIVPERDPHALAAAIRRLADNPALRLRLGAAARERFLQRYTLAAWAADMTTVFEEALATGQ